VVLALVRRVGVGRGYIYANKTHGARLFSKNKKFKKINSLSKDG